MCWVLVKKYLQDFKIKSGLEMFKDASNIEQKINSVHLLAKVIKEWLLNDLQKSSFKT